MNKHFAIFLIFAVLFSAMFSIISYGAAIQDSTNYQPLLEDASKNKELFDKYVKDILNVDAKVDLLPESKMEEVSTLINPKGGKLDLNRLGKDVVSVKMLDKGGFSFKRKNKEGKEEELDLKGFDKVNVDEKTGHFIADGVELQSESGKGTFEKTKDGIKAKGQAKLFLEGTPYSIATEQGVEFKIKAGKLQSFSVAGQKDKPVYVYVGKDKVDVTRGTFTYFGDKTLYDSANTNKMMKQDNQFFVSQNRDGALSLNDYYFLDNGKLKVSSKGLFNPPQTMLSYNYGSKSVETPMPISKENAAGYSSINNLFKDYGYGSGSANKDARKAFFEKVFPGEKYSYSGEQNQKLLEAIGSGKANLYRAGEVDYEHNLNGYSKIQSDVANNQVIKKTPAVTFVDQKMVADVKPLQTKSIISPVPITRYPQKLGSDWLNYNKDLPSTYASVEEALAKTGGSVVNEKKYKTTLYSIPWAYEDEISLRKAKSLAKAEGGRTVLVDEDGVPTRVVEYTGKVSPATTTNVYGTGNIENKLRLGIVGMNKEELNVLKDKYGEFWFLAETKDGRQMPLVPGEQGSAVKWNQLDVYVQNEYYRNLKGGTLPKKFDTLPLQYYTKNGKALPQRQGNNYIKVRLIQGPWPYS